MNDSGAIGAVLIATAVALALVLLSPKVRKNRSWHAVVTPLASIIGSGFLVVAPLLGATVGAWAPLAMVLIAVLAWFIGDMVRFQIRSEEPLLASGSPPRGLAGIERASDVMLSLSYVISVAFYLRLLAAFALSGLDGVPPTAEPLLTTAVLLLIGGVGLARGLGALEALEDAAVAIKLSVIAALIVGLAIFDVRGLLGGTLGLPGADIADPWKATRVMAGLLLVVQGFETSRYLGFEYEPDLRSRTMAAAQLVSGGIYVVFVLLMLPLLDSAGAAVDETAVIGMSARVHAVLPPLLVLAAVMSQFSAAVADTVGSGGLIHEATRSRVPVKLAYAGVTLAAVVLTWTADIFEVIALASRGFALYYALQSSSAALVAKHLGRRRRSAGFLALAVLLFFCAAIAEPAG